MRGVFIMDRGYFNGKLIADCEVLSFNRETGVGLANFRGALVKFEGHEIELDSRATRYANLDIQFLDSHIIKLIDREAD